MKEAVASRKTCAGAQSYYEQKRDEGHSHARALRCLGKRWLKILWRVWQEGPTYDKSNHLRILQRRGLPVWPQLALTAAGE